MNDDSTTSGLVRLRNVERDDVHRLLGPGLLESIYEEALCVEFGLRGVALQRQAEVDVISKGHIIKGMRVVLVDDQVNVELKAVTSLPEHSQKSGHLKRPEEPSFAGFG